jgi:hypothetical protein
MRGAIIITLIVVGGLLVVAPLVVGHLERTDQQANVVRVLIERPGVTNVNLHRDDIPVMAQVGCWAVGAALAVAGVVLAVRELRPVFNRPGDSGGVVSSSSP